MAQYISKSALVAEIERRRESNAKEKFFGRLVEDNYFLDFLNTLKVKEVDLDTEIAKWEESFNHCPASMGYKETAKHFYELGLKAQKGEEV